MSQPGRDLTQRSYLNSAAAILDYASHLLVSFFITPFLVAGLGGTAFGAWQICRRLMNYMEAAEGRSMQALKWTIANKVAATDDDAKRRDVGSAIRVWLFFFPIQLAVGATLAWFSPVFMGDLPQDLVPYVRGALLLLVLNQALSGGVKLPESVLIGMNLAYKAMGARALTTLIGAGVMIVLVNRGWSLPGLSLSVIAATLLLGLIFLAVARRNVPWLGTARPTREEFRKFFGFNAWVLLWSFVNQILLGADVVILGTLTNPDTVTSYVLTFYLMQTGASVVVMLVGGAIPGLGGLVGAARMEAARSVRAELMSATWLIGTVLGCVVLVCNQSFVGLWVDPERFAGPAVNLMLVLLLIQQMIFRNDALIIDTTLSIGRKVLWGSISTALAVLLGVSLGSEYGIVGMVGGLMLGRSVLSVAFPALVGAALGARPLEQFAHALRPAIALAALFGGAWFAADYVATDSWFVLIPTVAATGLVALGLAAFLGLGASQRATLWARASRVAELRRG